MFSPLEASDNITKKYSRYLHTIFSIDNEEYNRQFQSQLDNMNILASGPFLDVSDSFEKGKSIAELIEMDYLAKGFYRIGLPTERPLYKHQEVAINKVLKGDNLIVSTGTGSGKTESFMIPILNHLLREDEVGNLDEGVRALLIYPMNALANDQIERLRELLTNYPNITYGSYTGQTKEKFKDAIIEYHQLNDGRDPDDNELISREQIKNTPPHILVTNYAMLEYLMVRPGDSIFFDERNSHKWKYIVLDEAHVYNGSSGIEVAMLLRRLKAKLQNDGIQYILTSATLGDEKSNSEVASFGENLCNSTFDVNNIVRAYRITPEINHNRNRLDKQLYNDLARMIDRSCRDEDINTSLYSLTDYTDGLSVEENLYNIILHDENYEEIRKYAEKTPTIKVLSEKMGWKPEEIASFVTVASKAEKNGDRLFDARYHMFLRATESVFITLNPSNKLFLTRRKRYIENDGKDYAVFEIATCNVCHAIYILGTIKDDHLEQSSFQNGEDIRSVFLLKDEISDTDDDHSMEEEDLQAEEYEICPRCAFIRRAGLAKDVHCDHNTSQYVKVFRVQTKKENGAITKCLSCENTNGNGILRMFFTGQEAVTSVVGTALFEELPAYEQIHEVIEDDDEFGFDFSNDVTITSNVSKAKQFIAFSDSRQAAAFYASYLDQTYHGILYKRLIVETLKNVKEGWEGKSVSDFVSDLAAQFEQYNIAKAKTNQSIKESWKAILQEMADNNGITSLFRMGLLAFSFEPQLIPENKNLGLSKDEVCTLCNVIALGMMADAAILYDYSMNQIDKEFFAHNGVEYSYTLSDPDTKAYRRSFIPRFANRSNKRTDYVDRVLKQKGKELEQEKVIKVLESIWKLFERKELIKPVNGAFKVDSGNIKIVKPDKWYVCDKCKRITPYNLSGVCTSYRCTGELTEINLKEKYKENHYYRIYQDLDIRDLRVVEHTAQLSKETAYKYQRDFKKKDIDVLSCSTTFEMGVDVGSLETVFMRNMPPSPANYAQRAGRAGRSKNAAAFALTFCNKSNHDFAFFADPKQMIRGRIDPPKFIVGNEKIAIRHIYASALAFFWAKYPDYFSNAATMTEDTGERISGAKQFSEYLLSRPDDLKDYIVRFLPEELVDKFGVDSYGWLDRLLGTDEDNPGVLTKAVAEYDYEVGTLKQAKEDAIKNDRYSDRITERIKVYQRENILSFLSRKNVMPKYGFPVDTVELLVNGKGDKGRLGLQLSRDLAVAISEYAPGSQIVANGNLITSRYIRKVPKMSWKMYDYINCKCRTMNIEPHVEETDTSQLCTCHQCAATLDPAKRKVFLVPEFGFEADGDRIEKPGLKKPERTYRGDVSYVGYRSDVETKQFDIGGAMIEIAASRSDEMAVVNDSNFFVCETCGYTDLDEKTYTKIKNVPHKNNGGYPCGNKLLKKFSLGYRFETDVLQMRFLYPDLDNYEDSLSVLYGVMRGICRELNIEQNEIAGCVQYFYNDATMRPNYSLVFYDKTPGGAGHVRRLSDKNVLKNIFVRTLDMMKQCNCGGDSKDSSCYQCLRSYYNQKYHDILSRKIVIDFMESLFQKPEKIGKIDKAFDETKVPANFDIRADKDIEKNSPIEFLNAGSNQNSSTATEIWENILDDCDEIEERRLIQAIIERNKENISKPIYGETVKIVDTNEVIDVDLIWKDKRVMLFLAEGYEDYKIAQKSGWHCFCTQRGFDIDELLGIIEE